MIDDARDRGLLYQLELDDDDGLKTKKLEVENHFDDRFFPEPPTPVNNNDDIDPKRLKMTEMWNAEKSFRLVRLKIQWVLLSTN